MYVLHHAFRRDLDDFLDAAERLPIDDRAAWRRLDARWRTFGELLHDRHTKEDDCLWSLLTAKSSAAGDLAALATLAEMESEHESIDPLLNAVTAELSRLASVADEDVRAALLARLVDTRQSLGDHLSHEERDAIAILQRYVSGEEWAALEASAHVDKGAGPPFRIIHRLNRAKFARAESAAFGA